MKYDYIGGRPQSCPLCPPCPPPNHPMPQPCTPADTITHSAILRSSDPVISHTEREFPTLISSRVPVAASCGIHHERLPDPLLLPNTPASP
ncbi:MAG: hypothetical protein RL023_652 [Candidatus Parcubacteria bacterium]